MFRQKVEKQNVPKGSCPITCKTASQMTHLKACLLQCTVILQLRIHGDRLQVVGYIATTGTTVVVVGMD